MISSISRAMSDQLREEQTDPVRSILETEEIVSNLHACTIMNAEKFTSDRFSSKNDRVW